MNKFNPLKTALEHKGWSVSTVELASDHWWAAQIWELRSQWEPVGKTVYLLFLVDYQTAYDINNLPDTAIWAVGIATTIPKHFHEVDIAEVPVKNRFQSRVSEIVDLLDAVRNTENTAKRSRANLSQGRN